MIQMTVSRNDNIYECFPDIAGTRDGTLVCVYRECMGHGPYPFSRIVVRRSTDNGMNWSDRRILLECIQEPEEFDANRVWLENDAIAGYEESRSRIVDSSQIGMSINCPRLICLNDDTLMLIADLRISKDGKPPYLENRIWRSKDAGKTWDGPETVNLPGSIVPSLTQLKNGDILLGLATPPEPIIKSFVCRSTDMGRTWEEPVYLPLSDEFELDEVGYVELDDGTIVGFGRNYAAERRGGLVTGIKIISKDGGKTWDGPFNTWLLGLEGRPKVGLLKSGEICITYRCDMPNELLAMHVMTQEAAKSPEIGERIERIPVPEDIPDRLAKEKGIDRPSYMTSYYPGRTVILDIDRSVHRDSGYSGWVQLENGDIFVVDYINDDAPLAQIRGYLVSRHDYMLFPDGDLPWLHPSGQPFKSITMAMAERQIRINKDKLTRKL